MAEVAKYMRCSSPNREGSEAVAQAATEAVMGMLQKLRVHCKYGAVLEKWTQAVFDSLECESRAEFVEKLTQLIQIGECVRVMVDDKELSLGEMPELLKKNLCDGRFVAGDP
ncbi:unnamed protein product [Heligmosomoides polygyrus]|uniref:Resolvase/invertase-type recombinase catalytic domain-containing protein n=1 Tax=Heligmosomoides polygyrus TaxID=6339 RepID=A0A183G8R7_HELPZ|nr:unnamed protein product [Heligmosomoides polygyrus]